MGSFASTGDRQGFDWQRNKKIFCVFNLQEWPGQICREKTRIWCGSDRGLCGEFAFSQLLDNARNCFSHIANIGELNCANAWCGFFYKRTESKRLWDQVFLDCIYLHL